MDRLASFK
ncbi:hypothetical protein F383_33438 [Gossypium arboreum]|uniref:Uncharacterized protein n=1 Tax=Gossypium arboreum TaxID=29729 RepID=A0A0B0MBS8_GOSAR|nr:hypothetical protein F383_38499 [Gossypium arboreum]KHG01025.1 hypothetical protein F383_39162 [Gossypium arboreum]KHG06761.1 hypothetical protein F383_33438 [Gossypium arboreum]